MTTTKPHDKTDVAIAAVAAQMKIPADELKYDRSNLLRNLLHIRHAGSGDVYVYSTHTGTVYPPPQWYRRQQAAAPEGETPF